MREGKFRTSDYVLLKMYRMSSSNIIEVRMISVSSILKEVSELN